MNSHVDKTAENKSQSDSIAGAQIQSGGESTFQFVDNRSEAVTQRRLQEMFNNSPQVSQLKVLQDIANNNLQDQQSAQLLGKNGIIQRNSVIDWTSQSFDYTAKDGSTKTEEVGKTMVAKLEHKSPIKGSETDKTSPELYAALNHFWEPGSKKWVRGHILNADLGGPNTNNNLFPITGHANGEHSNFVEEHVKSALHRNNDVTYTVNAQIHGGETNGIKNAAGQFTCTADWNEGGEDKKIRRTIQSTPSLKKVPGKGNGARVNNTYSQSSYSHEDTEIERNVDGSFKKDKSPAYYGIDAEWAHDDGWDEEQRLAWIHKNRTGVATYHQEGPEEPDDMEVEEENSAMSE